MFKLRGASVQEHARHTRQTGRHGAARYLLVQLEVAVLVVSDDRKTEVRQVHADLMRPTGLQIGFEQ
jgi:hypothetical protein